MPEPVWVLEEQGRRWAAAIAAWNSLPLDARRLCPIKQYIPLYIGANFPSLTWVNYET